MKRAHQVFAALAAAAFTMSAAAHHSFAMFDQSRSITIVGTIQKMEWTNPHISIRVTVPSQSGGGSDDCPLETGGPSQMIRMGIPRSPFNHGDKIAVDINPMGDGRVGGHLLRGTMANGTTFDIKESSAKFAAGG